MTHVFLLRHGLTDANVNHIIMGRGPEPLNTEGKAQARRMAKLLSGVLFDAIYVSPAKRTLQTSQILMRGRDAIPLVQEEGVNEIEFGEWLGKSVNDIKDTELFRTYLYDPEAYANAGAELIVNVKKRVAAVMEKILGKHKDQRVAIVSHADVIKTILIHSLGLPLAEWQDFRIDNASISILRFADAKKPMALTINCHCDIERYCA